MKNVVWSREQGGDHVELIDTSSGLGLSLVIYMDCHGCSFGLERDDAESLHATLGKALGLAPTNYPVTT